MRAQLAKILGSWRTWIIGVPLLAGFFLLSRTVDLEKVHACADQLNDGLAFLLLTILPLAGFPVSVLHLAAGLKFGVARGIGLVALSILLQLLASHGLVHWRRNYFERKFKWLREQIPSGAHGAITLFTLLLPGVPYFAKNYVLPVVGIPLRTYLLWGFPIHTVRSAIAVAIGDSSTHLTPARVAAMAGYGLAILAASWWAFRRIKAQVGDRPKAAGDRTKSG